MTAETQTRNLDEIAARPTRCNEQPFEDFLDEFDEALRFGDRPDTGGTGCAALLRGVRNERLLRERSARACRRGRN
jgi:hypothetical protein